MRQFLLIAGLALVASVAGCNGGDNGTSSQDGNENPTVAFVTNQQASFWDIAEVGALKAGKDVGANVIVKQPSKGQVDLQNRILEDLLAQGVDGIAVSPIDPIGQKDLLNEIGNNTLYITHDSDAPETNRLCYIGMSNYEAGRMCGELVKEAIPDGGEVMIFVGRIDQLNAKQRRQGLIDELMDRDRDETRYDEPGKVIKNDKYTILDTRTDGGSEAEAKSEAEDALSKYPNLKCMVGLFEYNPPQMLAAVREAGKLGKIGLVGFDENAATLEGIHNGEVQGTIVQNPYQYGYKSIEMLAALAKGDQSVIPESKYVDIPARKITKDNVIEFTTELYELLGKEPPGFVTSGSESKAE